MGKKPIDMKLPPPPMSTFNLGRQVVEEVSQLDINI